MFAARRLASVAIAANPVRAKHTLPKLPYEYDALEPVICREIMHLHHCKHHQTYINNLNEAEEKMQEAVKTCDTSAMIALGAAIKFNGGGHINHSIFWNNLTPCSTDMSPELIKAIDCTFGSCDKFKERLCTLATGVKGSGWAWLGYDKTHKKLKLASCANQDPLQATTGLVPLFGIDVWEHAYYLQYKNVRADYVKAIMEIANWKDISERFKKASC